MSKLVDHDSVLPATRTENTIDLPSGLKRYSSRSPNGFDGTSPSSVPDRLTGVPLTRPVASSGAENSTPLRPSAQVSQWRTNMRSKTLPVALFFSAAARRVLLHTRSWQSRYTAIDRA